LKVWNETQPLKLPAFKQCTNISIENFGNSPANAGRPGK